MSRFIKAGNGTYNIKYIHSMTMNRDGQQGWLKVRNTDKENGYEKIRLTPEEYDKLEEILLTSHFHYELMKERNK